MRFSFPDFRYFRFHLEDGKVVFVVSENELMAKRIAKLVHKQPVVKTKELTKTIFDNHRYPEINYDTIKF